MTDAHIIATGGLGILALLVLYAHALYTGLPERVSPVQHLIAPAALFGPGLTFPIEPGAIVWVDCDPRFISPPWEGYAQTKFKWRPLDPTTHDLMRWADDGGPA
jgi:hypothetical protein